MSLLLSKRCSTLTSSCTIKAEHHGAIATPTRRTLGMELKLGVKLPRNVLVVLLSAILCIVVEKIATMSTSTMVSSFTFQSHDQLRASRSTSIIINNSIMSSIPSKNLFHEYSSRHFGQSSTSQRSRIFASTSNNINNDSANSFKVLFQKVVRPPPLFQQKQQESSSSKQQQKQYQQEQLRLFLPSLVHYLQSTYTLPQDLPMTYRLFATENDNEDEDTQDGLNDEGFDSSNSRSILEIKSPLAAPNDHRFHLFVEVVGIFTGNSNNNSNSLPSMAMVVIKSMKTVQSDKDVIRLRLFQDSMQRIIQSIDLGLDSYMAGDIPILKDTSSMTSYAASDKQNDVHGDDDNDGTWIGLDEYEGFQKEDTWEELQPIISTPTNQISSSWDKDVVIDTVATSDDQTPNKDTSGSTKNQKIPTRKVHNPSLTDVKTKSSTCQCCSNTRTSITNDENNSPSHSDRTSADYAVLAAQEIMKKRKEQQKSQVKSMHSAQEKDSKNNSAGGDFAVMAAKQVAEQRQGKQDFSHDDRNINSKDNSSGGDFALEMARKIAKSKNANSNGKTSQHSHKQQQEVQSRPTSRSKSTATPFEGSNTTKSSSSRLPSDRNISSEPKMSHGDSMDLEDMLPKLSPMITNRVDFKSKSFRVSISKPEQFSVSKSKKSTNRNYMKEERKITNTKGLANKQSNSNGEAIYTEENFDGNENVPFRKKVTNQLAKSEDTKEAKRRNLNIVTDYSNDTADDIPDDERQKTLNNLHLRSFTSTENSASTKPYSTGNKTKSREEIEQDIYKAALEIMPGSATDAQGDSTFKGGDITAEELLRDVLKFGEEKEKDETVGTAFVEGAFNKAKELISVEADLKQDQSYGLGYKETSSKSDEDELKQIFEAGQRIAEGLTTVTLSSGVSTQGRVQAGKNAKSSINNNFVTNEYVDELIDADKTVSRNVRSLDEELAELELRVSRAPDEDVNKGNNDIFDIFSGPELYNPNVDPESSINWPGAQPGTRTDINLPPALSAAVKNARYASGLLKKIIEQNDVANVANIDEKTTVLIDGKEISNEQIRKLQQCVEEGIGIGLIDDPYIYMAERSRLDMVVDELEREPVERYSEIIVNYKDLLLSENFVIIVKEKLQTLIQIENEASKRKINIKPQIIQKHIRVRMILEKLVQYAQVLLKETRALGAELEATQLEIIRSICQVAMDPSHECEEETSIALTDAVRDLKPLLDENFVAYLKYAIAEEQGRLSRAGILDDPEHNRWLFVLKIIQEGVYAELSKGVQRYIDHIGYVLRMETKRERRLLLSQLIDVMPSMDVRPFVRVIENIAGSLGAGSKGDFDTSAIDPLTNQILQLRRDVHDLLPPERIKVMSKDADEWAAQRRKKLLEYRGVSQQRLKAAKESEDFDFAVQRGEIDRFD